MLRRTEAAAGYFIKNWQALTDQVRALLLEPLSLQALRLVKTERGKLFQDATLQNVEERGRKWGKLSARMPTLQVDQL